MTSRRSNLFPGPKSWWGNSNRPPETRGFAFSFTRKGPKEYTGSIRRSWSGSSAISYPTAFLTHRKAGASKSASKPKSGRFFIGFGIPVPALNPGRRKKVFARFYRADKARGQAEGHSGLGLYIAKRLVESHGGWIKAGNAEDGGAVVTFAIAAQTRKNRAIAPAVARQPPCNCPKIAVFRQAGKWLIINAYDSGRFASPESTTLT